MPLSITLCLTSARALPLIGKDPLDQRLFVAGGRLLDALLSTDTQLAVGTMFGLHHVYFDGPQRPLQLHVCAYVEL